jgi:hypothetical protein
MPLDYPPFEHEVIERLTRIEERVSVGQEDADDIESRVRSLERFKSGTIGIGAFLTFLAGLFQGLQFFKS